jgi:hypothetical protein
MRKLFILLFVLSCSEGAEPGMEVDPIEAGMPGGTCYGNGTCNEGLVCKAWVCVYASDVVSDLEEVVAPDLAEEVFVRKDGTEEVGDIQPNCDCGWRVCGPDGCGGSCGDCEGTDECETGLCVCQPNCAGKECGADGCGGSCGSCSVTELCDTEICVPVCDINVCGPNGMGGSCGVCEYEWEECIEGQCEVYPSPVIWVSIPGGSFEMGCSPGDTFCQDDEYPVHVVNISSFEMQAAEVTVWQWVSVFGTVPVCPGQGTDSAYPAGCATWEKAVEYCEAIGGRLPTEAEWEYAARGGTTTRFYCGDDPACVYDIGWGRWNAPHGATQKVMGKLPNAYGLYDMIGNVREWTADYYGPYNVWEQYDPKGPSEGEHRVSRGGSAAEGTTGVSKTVLMSISTRLPLSVGQGYHPIASMWQGFRCVRD